MVRTKKTLTKSPQSSSTPAREKRRYSLSPSKRNKSPVTPKSKKTRLEVSSSHTSSSGTGRRRQRPGRKALSEIRYYQRTSNLLIQRLPFGRVVREIMQNLGATDFRVQSLALEALQEAAESFIIRYMEEANLCAIHCKRVTIMAKDMQLVRQIKSN